MCAIKSSEHSSLDLCTNITCRKARWCAGFGAQKTDRSWPELTSSGKWWLPIVWYCIVTKRIKENGTLLRNTKDP